jgi:hypothetical protein
LAKSREAQTELLDTVPLISLEKVNREEGLAKASGWPKAERHKQSFLTLSLYYLLRKCTVKKAWLRHLAKSRQTQTELLDTVPLISLEKVYRVEGLAKASDQKQTDTYRSS